MFYTYQLGVQTNYIIYIWQGRHANVDELTASAYLAVELDRQVTFDIDLLSEIPYQSYSINGSPC